MKLCTVEGIPWDGCVECS